MVYGKQFRLVAEDEQLPVSLSVRGERVVVGEFLGVRKASEGVMGRGVFSKFQKDGFSAGSQLPVKVRAGMRRRVVEVSNWRLSLCSLESGHGEP